MSDGRRVSLHPRAQEELVELARSGGPHAQQALEVLFEQYDRYLRSLLPAAGLTPQRVEDALQGARYGFWVAIQRYDRSKGASLATFARMFVLEHARLERQRSVDRFTRSVWAARQAAPNLPPLLQLEALDEECHPATKSDDVVTRLAVRDFVKRLKPPDQQLVILVYWRGFRPAEAARHLGVSPSAVSQRLARIHKAGQLSLADFTPGQ